MSPPPEAHATLPTATPPSAQRAEKLERILQVAKLLNAERQLDAVLPLVLTQATQVVDADRCSLFLLDRERNELWSKVAQGATSEIRVPVGVGIAGTVAQTGEVVNIPDAYADARFNRSYDVVTGYRTRSILCVPMFDASGSISGVLQALNKTGSSAFTTTDEELLLALGGQAAVAIENVILHEEISSLFEGFVSAAVVAIESRDPSTAGHSSRVADLTLTLAQSLERVETGSYARTHFTAEDIQELRYASLLHDFGKVGVREPVLVKAEKLYPEELRTLRNRFDLARKDKQLHSYRRRVDMLGRGASLSEVTAVEEERLSLELKELDELFEFVLACNRPTVLAAGNFERLKMAGQLEFENSRGARCSLLEPHEVEVLSIPKGSLSAQERREIESHVEHTYRFLSQIPWTRTLRRVPEIAYAHHEKLNGGGYPRAIAAQSIPVQSKMMAISDIYDALTASDRPYKKAVPHALALDILHSEAKGGQLDPELLRIFVEAEVPLRALRPKGSK